MMQLEVQRGEEETSDREHGPDVDEDGDVRELHLLTVTELGPRRKKKKKLVTSSGFYKECIHEHYIVIAH